MEIALWFTVIAIGTWAFSYVLSFYWTGPFGRLVDRWRGKTPSEAASARTAGSVDARVPSESGVGVGD